MAGWVATELTGRGFNAVAIFLKIGLFFFVFFYDSILLRLPDNGYLLSFIYIFSVYVALDIVFVIHRIIKLSLPKYLLAIAVVWSFIYFLSFTTRPAWSRLKYNALHDTIETIHLPVVAKTRHENNYQKVYCYLTANGHRSYAMRYGEVTEGLVRRMFAEDEYAKLRYEMVYVVDSSLGVASLYKAITVFNGFKMGFMCQAPDDEIKDSKYYSGLGFKLRLPHHIDYELHADSFLARNADQCAKIFPDSLIYEEQQYAPKKFAQIYRKYILEKRIFTFELDSSCTYSTFIKTCRTIFDVRDEIIMEELSPNSVESVPDSLMDEMKGRFPIRVFDVSHYKYTMR
ncbi:hypothetical protein GC194_00010 [bacterium]|nr:hypothetical protein [bacterium]